MCSVIGILRVWVSDTVNYFMNYALRLMAENLGVDYRLSMANKAWANGTLERTRLDIETFRAMATAATIPLKEWVRIVPVVQAVFNAGY